jgi:signal transduction histidine kinase
VAWAITVSADGNFADGAAVVRADQRKLVQVLINLVQNALDVAPSGSAVEIEAFSDGTRARLAVLRSVGWKPTCAITLDLSISGS